MRRMLVIFLAVCLDSNAPALAETLSADGTVTTYSEVMRLGETCEAGAALRCKPDQPCFARIVIEGQAARALYDAMKWVV
jgi:hypothetical protein